MRRFMCCFVIGLFVAQAHALDEGMFPMSELGRLNLEEIGILLSADEIFSSEGHSLVHGICRVNGCTGSLISSKGLLITNHHCAYRAIQSSSNDSADYLEDGFLAKERSKEIPALGYTVRITESFRDVSSEVLGAVDDSMEFLARTKAIEKRQKELEKQTETENPGMRAEVAEMFTGKTYVLFLYTYLRDVRLVYAPPSSIGNFGGDVDNWEWPRHTGDFTFMRAYVSPDGSPADYSPDNIPYEPKRFIQVAPEGVQENDVVFLLGYPGRTARHKTAQFLCYEQDVRLPFVVDLYQWQISVMEGMGAEDRSVALKHASRSKSLANVEKRSRGQLKGLRRAGIIEKKRAEEDGLKEFILSDPKRTEKYGQILEDIASVYLDMAEGAHYELLVANFKSACRYMAVGYTVYEASVERLKSDLERESAYMDRNFDQTKKSVMLSVDDLHAPTDQVMLKGMLERLSEVEETHKLPGIGRLLNAVGSSNDFMHSIYENSQLGDPAFVESALAMSPDELKESKDPFLALAASLHPTYESLREKNKEREGALNQLYGHLIEVKKDFLETSFVPDANGTLRLTYGQVRGYSPEDAVYKSPITTLGGVVDKTTGVDPFVTPDKVLELHGSRDFGRFEHIGLGDVPVGILYSADTTGGNSGSPIFNAKGQLVGVNFDRAFEATINDFAWNESYSRSIGVDIRYVLWLVEKFANASALLEELGLESKDSK